MSPIVPKRIVFLLLKMCLLVAIFIVSIILSFYCFYPQESKANILILGISGPGHEGSTLTDSIILGNLTAEGIKTISLPRDLWYPPYQTKINALYYYGLEKGTDLQMVNEAVGQISGQSIDHWVIIDFNTFQKLIDWLGGIDIFVDRSFADDKFPIPGKENDLCDGDREYQCRYESISFSEGWQTMDGETALKFVRSRNAQGDEGTDSARSLRQEKVIAALKSKILNPQILLNFDKLNQGVEIVSSGIKTDLTWEKIFTLRRILLSALHKQTQGYVLNDWETTGGLLYHPEKHSSGQWVLLPKDSSWGLVRQSINNFLEASE